MNVLNSYSRWDLKNDKAIAKAVRHARIPLCISDPNLTDNPIVFANSAFFDLTGYSENEVIGQNCRFLQGSGTTSESCQAVRNAIDAQKVETVEIINYRKDGSSFTNALQIGPIFDDDGQLVFFFGSQLDVTEKREAESRARELAEHELVHRLGNIVNVMGVVIQMTAREERDAEELGQIVTERLQTLSKAHFQTITRPENESLTIAQLTNSILIAYAPLGEKHFKFRGLDATLPPRLISCTALILHELSTNSVKHGALGVETGKVNLAWTIDRSGDRDTFRCRWRETGGPNVSEPKRRSGSRIIVELIEAIGGSMALNWKPSGLIVDVVFPI